jgi:indolepyruvate decarboxylase
MEDFITGLLKTNIHRRKEKGRVPSPLLPPGVIPGRKITIRYLYQRLNSFLEKEMVVIADTGDAMFAAMDMTIHKETEFLSAAYYASLGFAVPASLGVQMAKPELRPLVLVGDGAFQMSGMELSTIVRFHLNPIIVILNNRGYGTERYMRDGPFNDLNTWVYSRIPEILKSGKGFDIKTEDQLEVALHAIRNYTESFCILDVHIDPEDCSIALQRMTKALKKRT